MAILPIYVYDQPVLRRKAKTVRAVDGTLIKLAEDMFETMHNASGIGLAANQVGVPQRMVVIDITGTEEGKDMKPLVLINPEVTHEEGEVTLEEGCLSLPD
ncbi:MAG TPA: peptide deformylase, partial [Bacteroidota bacterium]